MKKKTFLLLTALLLLSATLLCSCGGAENLKFSSVVDAKAYVDTTPTLTTATALSMKGRVADYAGTLVLFEDEDTSTISVYSVSEDKVVFTASDSRVSTAGKTEYVDYSVDIMVSEGMVWFSVIKVTRTMDMDTLDAITSDREVSIYDEKGAVLLSGKDLNHSFDTAADLVFFKDKVYRAENGAFTEILTLNGLADAPSISKKAGKGYVGTSGKTISLYNERLELVASYIIPSYAADRKSCYVTKNGNVIIQYPVLCEADAQDYDLLLTENENETLHFVDISKENKESESLLLDGKKVNVETVLLSKKNSNGKKLNANYVLQELFFEEALTEEGLNASLGNVAAGYIIKDRRVNVEMLTLFTLTNDGKIKGYLDGYVPGDTLGLSMLYENRWSVSNRQGDRYLLDKKGKNLGEIGKYLDYDELGILSNDQKLYSWNLKLLADFNERGSVSSCTLLENGVIVRMRTGEVLYYTGGTTTTIAQNGENKTVRKLSDRLYAVETQGGDTVIYNDLGQQLYSLKYGTAIVSTHELYENGAIIQLNTFETGESYLIVK